MAHWLLVAFVHKAALSVSEDDALSPSTIGSVVENAPDASWTAV
jgi:hypothetical protein